MTLLRDQHVVRFYVSEMTQYKVLNRTVFGEGGGKWQWQMAVTNGWDCLEKYRESKIQQCPPIMVNILTCGQSRVREDIPGRLQLPQHKTWP